MAFDDIVLRLVEQNPRLTHGELSEIFARMIKSSLDRWRKEGRIVTEEGIRGYPFRYKFQQLTFAASDTCPRLIQMRADDVTSDW